MKVITTTVGTQRPEDDTHNEERLRAAEQTISKTTKLGADVLVLPGGFLTASSHVAMGKMADAMIAAAKRAGVAIVFGIDRQGKDVRTDEEWLRKGQSLPYYGYAWSPSEGVEHCWQQRSSTSGNQRHVPDRICEELRVLRVGSQTLSVLMCGEIFNRRIRQALADSRPRPTVVADVAHVGAGFRVWQGMTKLAELGLPSVCSVHVQSEFAAKHCYLPEKGRATTWTRDDCVFGPPRIELKVWAF